MSLLRHVGTLLLVSGVSIAAIFAFSSLFVIGGASGSIITSSGRAGGGGKIFSYSYQVVELRDLEGFVINAKASATVSLFKTRGPLRMPVVIPDELSARLYMVKLRPGENPRFTFPDPVQVIDYLESRSVYKTEIILRRDDKIPYSTIQPYQGGSFELPSFRGRYAIVTLLVLDDPYGNVDAWIELQLSWRFKATYNQVLRALILALAGALLLASTALRRRKEVGL